MEQRRRVLVVDDHEEMVRLLSEELTEAGFDVLGATSAKRALDLAQEARPDVVVTDLRMPNGDGLDVLDGLHALDPDLPVIVLTAFGTVDGAVDVMRRGAAFYLTKPFRSGEVAVQVRRALGEHAPRLTDTTCRSTHPPPTGFIGTSAPMLEVYRMIARVAPTDTPVFIRGESGTGKERAARSLHEGSLRATKPFLTLNCASVPATLLESELFGHVRGSFTGATNSRRGLFVAAHTGTLFLDEIGDMPIELQAHLLRVLEDGIVRPVGSDEGRPVDVRIIAATHQDLEARRDQGRFRADLFYRLDVLSLRLPPLRARVEDLPDLFAAFVVRCAPTLVERLGPDALEAFERYTWPGNVRELENVVRRLCLLVDRAVIRKEDLRAWAPQVLAPRGAPQTPLERAQDQLPTLRQLETDYIAWVSDQCAGNKTRAAELLGIDVSTIHRRLRSTEKPE